MFVKGLTERLFGKGVGGKILGAVKGISTLVSEPVVQRLVHQVSPEVGRGLAEAKRLDFWKS